MKAVLSSSSVGQSAHPDKPSKASPDRQSYDKLLAQLRQGDEAAYEALVREYGGRMLAVARRMLRCEEDARDAVQDAFLQAFRSIDCFRGDSNLGTWLHRIVANAALMKLRSMNRHPVVTIEELWPQFDNSGHHAQRFEIGRSRPPPHSCWTKPAPRCVRASNNCRRNTARF